MVLILLVVISLVAWALYLMQSAVKHREFSLMLAGVLVSVAAAGLTAVYFLVGNCLGYMTQVSENQRVFQESYGLSPNWEMPADWFINETIERAPTLPQSSLYGMVPEVNRTN